MSSIFVVFNATQQSIKPSYQPIAHACITSPISWSIKTKDLYGVTLIKQKLIQCFLDYPYLVYPAFDYPFIGSDNNLWHNNKAGFPKLGSADYWGSVLTTQGVRSDMLQVTYVRVTVHLSPKSHLITDH